MLVVGKCENRPKLDGVILSFNSNVIRSSRGSKKEKMQQKNVFL